MKQAKKAKEKGQLEKRLSYLEILKHVAQVSLCLVKIYMMLD